MNRRKALKQLGLGLSAGMIMPHLLTSCRKDDPGPEVDYDGVVAIIGAGLAGLYAADILHAKGVKVIILEASNQLGGRVQSLRNQTDAHFQAFNSSTFANFPVELGAEVIYGSDSIWGKTIQNMRAPTVSIKDLAQDQFIIENQIKFAEGWAGDGDFVAAQSFVSGLKNYAGADSSVQSAAAGLASRVQPLLNSQIGNFYGSANTNVGINGLAEALNLQLYDGKWLAPISNPMQDIVVSRFSGVWPMVQFNSPVESVAYAGDLISIKIKGGDTIQANKLIVTAPVSIIKSGDISFSPGLPGDFTSSLAKVGMDNSIRVVLDFKKNIWDADVLNPQIGFMYGGSTAPQYFCAGIGRVINGKENEYDPKTLSITINGAAADALSPLGANMITPILTELDSVFNNNASGYVRRDLQTSQIISLIKDWGKEEYIKGSYSYLLPGGTINDRKNIGTPIDGKLFFAGEATDVKGFAGTMNGALNSAERVAEDVVKSILGI